MEETIRKNYGLILTTSKILNIQLDEDWEQIGRMEIFKAARDFDPLRGFQFSTVAMRYIKNAFISELDRRNRWNRVEVRDGLEPPSQNNAYKQIDAKLDAAHLIKGLNVRERKIIKRRIEGETLKKIGERYGLAAERVRQLEERGLRRIRYNVFMNRGSFRMRLKNRSNGVLYWGRRIILDAYANVVRYEVPYGGTVPPTRKVENAVLRKLVGFGAFKPSCFVRVVRSNPVVQTFEIEVGRLPTSHFS